MAVICFLPLSADNAGGGNSSVTASEAFSRMPMKYLDLLDPSTRLDMLDYFAADSVYQATNNFGGLSELTDVSPDYLRLKLTPVSTWQFRVIHARKGDIVVAAYTVGDSPASSDTSLYFFDAMMNPLPLKKYFPLPVSADFFSLPSGAPVSKKDIDEMISFLTVVYTLSPDNDSINARITVGEYMNRDDYNKIKPYLIPDGLTYIWDGSRYRLRKN